MGCLYNVNLKPSSGGMPAPVSLKELKSSRTELTGAVILFFFILF
jgi:hypothetical protein